MSTKPSRRRVEPWVGPWLQELRLGAAMKREQIAERLKRNLSAVSRIESGVSSIPADDLPVVLRAYGTTAEAYAAKARRVSSRSAA